MFFIRYLNLTYTLAQFCDFFAHPVETTNAMKRLNYPLLFYTRDLLRNHERNKNLFQIFLHNCMVLFRSGAIWIRMTGSKFFFRPTGSNPNPAGLGSELSLSDLQDPTEISECFGSATLLYTYWSVALRIDDGTDELVLECTLVLFYLW